MKVVLRDRKVASVAGQLDREGKGGRMLKEWMRWGSTLVRLVSKVQLHFQSVGKPLVEEDEEESRMTYPWLLWGGWALGDNPGNAAAREDTPCGVPRRKCLVGRSRWATVGGEAR